MKKLRNTTLLTLALALLTMTLVAARPSASIEDIVISRNMDGNSVEGLNIRVNVENVGTEALEEPTVTLWVRRDWQDNWRMLETWSHHEDLDAGDTHSHDYFAYGTGNVDPALFSDSFEVKATLYATNQRRQVSKEVYYPDSAD